MTELFALNVALSIAIRDGEFYIANDSNNDANNMRQRFYRYRENIRLNPKNTLYLLVDDLHFEINGRTLVITYNNPNQKILESINDDQETGGQPPNPQQRITDREG